MFTEGGESGYVFVGYVVLTARHRLIASEPATSQHQPSPVPMALSTQEQFAYSAISSWALPVICAEGLSPPWVHVLLASRTLL